RKKPPDKFEKIGPWKIGNFVPEDTAPRIFGSIGGKALQIPDALRIELNFPTVLGGKAFNLFNDAKFSSVASVQKGRYDRESQLNWSLKHGQSQQPGSLPGPRQQVLAGEKEFRGRAREAN